MLDIILRFSLSFSFVFIITLYDMILALRNKFINMIVCIMFSTLLVCRNSSELSRPNNFECRTVH